MHSNIIKNRVADYTHNPYTKEPPQPNYQQGLKSHLIAIEESLSKPSWDDGTALRVNPLAIELYKGYIIYACVQYRYCTRVSTILITRVSICLGHALKMISRWVFIAFFGLVFS